MAAEQVLDLVVVEFDVDVARHAERRVAAVEVHAGEHLAHVQADHRLERREDVVRPPGGGVDRQGDEARQDAGGLDDGEEFFGVAGAAQHDGEVERLVEQVRERVAGVDGQGGEDGEYLPAEDLADVPPVGVGEILEAAQDDPLAIEAGQHLRVEAGVGRVRHLAWRAGRFLRGRVRTGGRESAPDPEEDTEGARFC